MKIIEWLSMNKEWVFSGIGVTIAIPVGTFVIKKIVKKKDEISKALEKRRNKKKNMYIFITGFNNDNPFSINYKKSTPIDFVSWNEKIKSGGKIICVFEYTNEMNNYLKKNKVSEKKRKEIYDGIRRVEDVGKIIELMIKKALLEERISDRIQDFPLFVESAIHKCFGFIRPQKECTKTLEVYNGNNSFKFDISEEEYNEVFKKSEGKIGISDFMFFNEFMNLVTDKSILESEIMPTYLKINAIQEVYKGKEIAIEDFNNWWISIG